MKNFTERLAYAMATIAISVELFMDRLCGHFGPNMSDFAER